MESKRKKSETLPLCSGNRRPKLPPRQNPGGLAKAKKALKINFLIETDSDLVGHEKKVQQKDLRKVRGGGIGVGKKEREGRGWEQVLRRKPWSRSVPAKKDETGSSPEKADDRQIIGGEWEKRRKRRPTKKTIEEGPEKRQARP